MSRDFGVAQHGVLEQALVRMQSEPQTRFFEERQAVLA
jgi:hypothetical protein